MASEYLKPMLDVGSPRILNCNVITKNILANDPEGKTFFRCKPLNKIVVIKDIDTSARDTANAIGTKLYLPFNENEIYEGGRTIFVHDKHLANALIDSFGMGALPKERFDEDLRIMAVLDKLPSLDPFLLKDVFIQENIEMNPAYFEVDKELWDQIEKFILQSFEPLAKAAFPDALASEEVAHKLVQKIWEGRDLEALKPLIMAFRLPAGQELQIFAAWKGINFYGFQNQQALPARADMIAWINAIKIPVAAVSALERAEFNTLLDTIKKQMQKEMQAVDRILKDYQSSYDKMFSLKEGSNDFLEFLRNSNKSYWVLGNSLGKIGHATYCWDVMSKRYPGRKMPWDQTREFVGLLAKIFSTEAKPASAVKW